YFRTLVDQDPINGLAHYGLAEIYYNRKLYDRAGQHFAACTDLSPAAYICYLRMVDSWVFRNPVELQRHMPKDPNSQYRYLTLAKRHAYQRKFPEALEALRAGLDEAHARNDLELQAVFHGQQSVVHSQANEGFSDALSHSI